MGGRKERPELGAAGSQEGAAVGKPPGGWALLCASLSLPPTAKWLVTPWPGGPHCGCFQVTSRVDAAGPDCPCAAQDVLSSSLGAHLACCWRGLQAGVLGTGDAGEGLASPLSSPPGARVKESSSPLPSLVPKTASGLTLQDEGWCVTDATSGLATQDTRRGPFPAPCRPGSSWLELPGTFVSGFGAGIWLGVQRTWLVQRRGQAQGQGRTRPNAGVQPQTAEP